MSVYDNMAFGLKLRKTPKADIDRRVKESASLLGIESLLDRKPKQLSGGQRQRVALGRAIVREPAVFLMDEPLSNLDAKLRVQTRSEIAKLHQRLETTFIYVTHDQTEAMTMGTRIAVMKDGLLQQLDTPHHLYQLPDNVFVAGFIGSPSMNFFDATIVEEDGTLWVDGGTFRLRIPSQKTSVLQAYKGKEVVFGVRPEDVFAKPYLPTGHELSDMKADVDVTELMGNEVILYLLTGKKQFIGRVDPRTDLRPGNKGADIAINMDNAHFFDPQTERAIR